MKKFCLQIGSGICLVALAIGLCSCTSGKLPPEQPSAEEPSSAQSSSAQISSAQSSEQVQEEPSEAPSSFRLCGISGSLPGVTLQPEMDLWAKPDFVEETAEKKVRVEAFGKTVEGTYVRSTVRFGEFHTTRQYIDADGNEFSLTPEGQVCAYHWKNAPNEGGTGEALTVSECIAIANGMLETLVDLQAYAVHVQFDEATEVYQISYQRTNILLPCADQATVTMDPYGRVQSFVSTQLGKMDAELLELYHACTAEDMDDRIRRRVNDKYQYIFDRYESYSDKTSHLLTQNTEGKAVLLSTLDLELQSLTDSTAPLQPLQLQFCTILSPDDSVSEHRLPRQNDLPANSDPAEASGCMIQPEYPMYSTVAELLEAVPDIYTGTVTDISFDILNMSTGESDLSYSEDEAVNRNRQLYTVYTVERFVHYQGTSDLPETIHVMGGLCGYKEDAQRELLETTGLITKTNGQIPFVPAARKLSLGESYLFCTYCSGSAEQCYMLNPTLYIYRSGNETAMAIRKACEANQKDQHERTVDPTAVAKIQEGITMGEALDLLGKGDSMLSVLEPILLVWKLNETQKLSMMFIDPDAELFREKLHAGEFRAPGETVEYEQGIPALTPSELEACRNWYRGKKATSAWISDSSNRSSIRLFSTEEEKS